MKTDLKNTLGILKTNWNDISKWKGPLSSKRSTSLIKIKTKQNKKNRYGICAIVIREAFSTNNCTSVKMY